MELLKLNEPITFGAKGNVAKFALKGWSLNRDEVSISWTDDYVAELGFRLAPPRGEITLHFTASPYLVEDLVAQQFFSVFLNGSWVWFGALSSETTFTLTVQREYFNARANILSFVLPTAVIPADISASRDRRRLGLAFQSLVLQGA